MLREQEGIFNTLVEFFVIQFVYLKIVYAEIMRLREFVKGLLKVFLDFSRREILLGNSSS